MPARFAVFTCLLALASAADASPTHVTVEGTRVQIRDLLRDAPAETAEIDLGPSPALGGTRLIARDEILQALRAHQATATPRLPESIRVTRASRTLRPDELNQMVREALPRDRLPRGTALRDVRPTQSVTVPAGWTAVSVDLARPPRRVGTFSATAYVNLRRGDDLIARVPVRVDLTLSAEAATPDLTRGSAVTLVVRHGLVEVRASGSAAADADIGETLPVVLRPSGRVIRARLIEPALAVALEEP
jgi:flagella basal body P-ring formation protein FlgA